MKSAVSAERAYWTTIGLMIGGALRVYSTNAGASADLLSRSIHGRLGCAVLSLST